MRHTHLAQSRFLNSYGTSARHAQKKKGSTRCHGAEGCHVKRPGALPCPALPCPPRAALGLPSGRRPRRRPLPGRCWLMLPVEPRNAGVGVALRCTAWRGVERQLMAPAAWRYARSIISVRTYCVATTMRLSLAGLPAAWPRDVVVGGSFVELPRLTVQAHRTVRVQVVMAPGTEARAGGGGLSGPA